MRELPEWIGATDDSPVPPRVRARVWFRDKGTCQCCGTLIMAGMDWQVDHRIAIANGGENRESNLQVLLASCHKDKTKADVAEKSKVARVRTKHLGIKKHQARPMPGTKASGIRKRMNGTIERW